MKKDKKQLCECDGECDCQKMDENSENLEEEELQSEISAAGGGAVAGAAGAFEKKREVTYESPSKFIEEVKLRSKVREILNNTFGEEISAMSEHIKKENMLRTAVREMIKEERLRSKLILSEARATPMLKSTGLNALQTVINKVIPIVKDDYKSLTTSVEQRRSFRAHIVNALKNALAPIRAVEKGNAEPGEVDLPAGVGQDDLETPMLDVPDETELAEADGDIDVDYQNGDVDVTGGNDETAQDKFIDIDAEPEEEEIPDEELSPGERAEKNFDVDGEDRTGRNFALDTFKRIEKIIIDEYMKLDKQEDKDIFYEYIITNFKLYFDRWEDEIQSDVPESE